MKLKYIFLIIIISIFISSCADYKTAKKDEKQYFTSSGFALIYDEDLYAKKIIITDPIITSLIDLNP